MKLRNCLDLRVDRYRIKCVECRKDEKRWKIWEVKWNGRIKKFNLYLNEFYEEWRESGIETLNE